MKNVTIQIYLILEIQYKGFVKRFAYRNVYHIRSCFTSCQKVNMYVHPKCMCI